MIKENIKLSELIKSMKEIIHNNGRYCFSDTLLDLIDITKRYENEEHFDMYWGVRENGTGFKESELLILKSNEDWHYDNIYKISCKYGLFSISPYEIK